MGIVGFEMREDAFTVLKKSRKSNGDSVSLKNSIYDMSATIHRDH